MQIRDLLKVIATDFKLDDEVFICDNYGCCVNITYIDRQEVYNRFATRTNKAMTLNIKQRIDLRKPEDMQESEGK